MPQNEKLPETWQVMLGQDWKRLQPLWLHRLGNLTLTGYNSTYSDRSFDEKKTIAGGFAESSVRLNKFVREQPQWTCKEIEQRGEFLADQALDIWSRLKVDPAAIESAKQAEMRELAGRRDIAKVPMSATARSLFENLRLHVQEIDPAILELAESKSVSYHASGFFLEVLPRKHGLSLLLPLDFAEIDDPHKLASDATQYKFILNSTYDGGVLLQIDRDEDIEPAIPIIRRACLVARTSGTEGPG